MHRPRTEWLAAALYALLLAAFILAAVCCASIGSANIEAMSEPKLRVVTEPRNTIALTPPVYVRLHVSILDPNRELFCPALMIEWGDGEHTSQVPDCVFSQEGDRPAIYRTVPRLHHYRGVGTWCLAVVVTDGGLPRPLRRTIRVQATGGLDDTEGVTCP